MTREQCEAYLGSILITGKWSSVEVQQRMDSAIMSHPDLDVILSALVTMSLGQPGQLPSFVGLCNLLQQRGHLDKAGGPAAIGALTDAATNAGSDTWEHIERRDDSDAASLLSLASDCLALSDRLLLLAERCAGLASQQPVRRQGPAPRPASPLSLVRPSEPS